MSKEGEILKIKMVAIETVKPYDTNPRIISEAAVDRVANSIREFGWRQPIVVDDDDVVIVGHTRLQAAQKMGLEEVPIHVADGLSKDQVRALRIADNKTHELSGWDEDLLGRELQELSESNVDVSLSAFDDAEVKKLLEALNPTPPDDFQSFGDDISTDHKCPKCGYEWSGKSK